jgi:hypothetical protein
MKRSKQPTPSQLDTIKINRIGVDLFHVIWNFGDHRETGALAFSSEHDASVWLKGFQYGFNVAKRVIGDGPIYDGKIGKAEE